MGGAGSHAAVGVARDDSISTIARRIDRPSAASVPNPSLSRRGCATPDSRTGNNKQCSISEMLRRRRVAR